VVDISITPSAKIDPFLKGGQGLKRFFRSKVLFFFVEGVVKYDCKGSFRSKNGILAIYCIAR